MAGWRRAVELAMTAEEIETLTAIREHLAPALAKAGYTVVDPGGYEDGTTDYFVDRLLQYPTVSSNAFRRSACWFRLSHCPTTLVHGLPQPTFASFTIFPSASTTTRSRVPTTRQFRRNAPRAGLRLQMLGADSRRDHPVSSSIGGQQDQPLAQSSAHYGI